MPEVSLRQKVEEIDEVKEQICSDWEQSFIESMMEWEGEYTEKQASVINKLYTRACNSPY